MKVKPTNGRSLPQKPDDEAFRFWVLGFGLTRSNSSKLDVSSQLVTVGMNGGTAGDTRGRLVGVLEM